MPSQFFGRFTKLDPPITIGSFTAGVAIQFNAEPFAPVGTGGIVSSTLITVSGSTTKTLTFARAMQQFSFTDNLGDENNYEALMGGNVCQTGENERGYSHRNSRAFRGGDARSRCEPGDVLWHNGRGFLITSATPFASAPSAVAWQSDDPVPTVWTWEALINNLALPRPDYPGNPLAVNVWEDDNVVFGGALLEIDNGGWEPVARFVFERPSDNALDPFYYPSAAQFSTSPTEAEYWFDHFGERFRLASHNESRGDAYRASWWVTGLEASLATATDERWGIEDTSNASGIPISLGGDPPDQLVMSAARTPGNFNRTFRVFKRTGAEYSLGWRADADPDAAAFGLVISGNQLVAVIHRNTSGSMSGVLILETITGDLVDVRVVKSGANFSAYYTQQGGSEVAALENVNLGVVTNTTGWLGAGAWGDSGVHFSGFDPNEDVHLVRVDADGRMGVRVSQHQGSGWTNVAYSNSREPKTAEPIQSIVNDTAGLAMTESATRRRDTYDITAGDIVVWSESSGDRIIITEAAPSTAPGGTGRAPQVPNTVNFATPNSSDVNENRAHWRDQVQIHDPDDEFEGTAGQSVEIRRNAVFDSRNPPVLAWSFRDNTTGDWTTMTSGTDYIGRWAAGIVFLSTGFLAGFTSGEEEALCIRAEGVRILHNGSQTARQFNDMAAALDEFDKLFCNVGSAGGGGTGFHGVGNMSGGPSGHTCDITNECWVPTGFSFGTNAFDMNAAGPFPRWVTSDTKRFASAGYDPSPGTSDCGSASLALGGVIQQGLFFYGINPNETDPFVNEPILIGSDVTESGGFPQISFRFSIQAPGLTINDVVAGLPEGSECVEAWVSARFSGLSRDTFHVSYETRTIQSLEPDVTIIENVTNQTNANLSLAIVLARKDSKQVLDENGNEITTSDFTFRFAGSGNVSLVGNNQWRHVDMTNAINGVIQNRDSRFTMFLLVPSLAPLTSGSEGLGGYLMSLIPDMDGEITATDDCAFDYRWEVNSSLVRADGLNFTNILARFRLPDGSLTPVLPIINPPHMVEP
jgi:hypothetical protein